MIEQSKLRNVAIIAHVDHGKTTLVDAFMKQSNLFRDNQSEMQEDMILDSGDLEREKGITIKAKNIAIRYKDYKINVIDTPGHADFGGEVERTLNMASGCVILVDAQEGVMPQTKFVLKKAFDLGLKVIVVINKIDKKHASVDKVRSKVEDLFLTLAQNDEQLQFPVYYAIGREGKVFEQMPEGDLTQPNSTTGNIQPLLDAIVEYLPAPKGEIDGSFRMQISSLEFDPHLGRYLIGRVDRGTIKPGVSVSVVNFDDKKVTATGRVEKLLVREGLEFAETDQAGAGEIVAISGVESTAIGSTLCISSDIDPLPAIEISKPSVKIKFEANSSPFVGREGKYVTMKQLQQRLDKEKDLNISLEITKSDGAAYYVAGRGELQLAILIEELRREGFEFQIRRPEVIFKEVDGQKLEPLEELVIDAPEEYVGAITQAVSSRKAEMVNMETENGQVRFTYKIVTRNLLGLRGELMTLTKGNAVVNSYIIDYVPFSGAIEVYRKGVLVSSETGTAMGYSLNTIQERGDLIIEPGTEVYEGMIIGINKYDDDIEVNPCKDRQKSNVRMSRAQINLVNLKQIHPMTLESAITFINDDEILEITPQNIRLRKAILQESMRRRAERMGERGIDDPMFGK